MINLFISYSHDNEKVINKLLPMFKELKQNNILDILYDRKLRPGNELWSSIDYYIRSCDICILLLSESYYNSKSCQKEKKDIILRKKNDGIYVLPIVAADCSWHDDNDLNSNLFLNTDAKSLTTLSDSELSTEIARIKNILESIANDIEIIKKLQFKPEFNDFLSDTDVFKTSHRSKNILKLSDIFIYPTLKKIMFDREKDDAIKAEDIFKDSQNQKIVMISGEDQSGKTALSKHYITEWKKKNFLLFYFSVDDNFDGHIFNILKKKFTKDYQVDMTENELDIFLNRNKEQIIIIIDDFHKLRNNRKILDKIKIFNKIFIIVDTLYTLDYELRDIEADIGKYAIKELSPLKRNELIEKWLMINFDGYSLTESEKLKIIDKKTAQIEAITYKSLNGGIMPAYPFLILSILSNVETLNKPLSKEITSYGYCYEALIIISLIKCGLEQDDEIGGFITFLSHLAFHMFDKEWSEISEIDFDDFLNKYEEKILLPFEKSVFIQKLEDSRLFIKTTLGNYRFDYKYVQYYFIAKYFTDNINDSIDIVKELCKNIHKDENAYVVIFFSHNIKSDSFIKILLDEANNIYSKYTPSRLHKDEMQFFNTSYKSLIDIVLPNKKYNYKKERYARLENNYEAEYSSENAYETDHESNDDIYSEDVINLRKSIKLVEVIGLVTKNRSTSLEKTKIKQLLLTAINLNLKLLASFFNLFKDPESQKEMINILSKIIKNEFDKTNNLTDEKCKKIAGNIFWGLNFLYVFIIIHKTVQAIGSEKIVTILREIVNDIDSPAMKIILEGVKMYFSKNIDKNTIFKYSKDKNFSDIAKSILNIFVVEHCRMNPTKYSELQQLSAKLNIKIEKLK